MEKITISSLKKIIKETAGNCRHSGFCTQGGETERVQNFFEAIVPCEMSSQVISTRVVCEPIYHEAVTNVTQWSSEQFLCQPSGDKCINRVSKEEAMTNRGLSVSGKK